MMAHVVVRLLLTKSKSSLIVMYMYNIYTNKFILGRTVSRKVTLYLRSVITTIAVKLSALFCRAVEQWLPIKIFDSSVMNYHKLSYYFINVTCTVITIRETLAPMECLHRTDPLLWHWTVNEFIVAVLFRARAVNLCQTEKH